MAEAMATMTRAEAEAFEHQHGRRPTLAERGVKASQRAGRGSADWENTRQFASIKEGEQAWVALVDERPDILHQLLGDVYIVTKYDERKRETGKRLDGRRVMPRDANLDELWDMITPRYSMESFGVAVKALIGTMSLRQFAAKVPMDHRELSRMMRGQSKPSVYWMERIAEAARVTPAYFVEWRIAFAVNRLAGILRQRPNLSIGVVKRMGGVPQLR